MSAQLGIPEHSGAGKQERKHNYKLYPVKAPRILPLSIVNVWIALAERTAVRLLVIFR